MYNKKLLKRLKKRKKKKEKFQYWNSIGMFIDTDDYRVSEKILLSILSIKKNMIFDKYRVRR